MLLFQLFFFSIHSFANHPCLKLLAPTEQNIPFPFRFHHAPTKRTLFADAIPNYNAETDFIFLFNPGGHVDLFIGPYFVHTDFQRFAPKIHQLIPNGVHVKVTASKEKIDQLVEFMEQKKHYQCWGLLCHHNALLLLQKNGIHLIDYVPIKGASIFSKILHEGFVNEKGERLEQEVILVHPNVNENLTKLYDTLRRAELSRGFSELLVRFDLKEHLQTLMSRDPRLKPILAAIEAQNFSALSPEVRGVIHEFFSTFESELLLLADVHGGSGHLLALRSEGKIDFTQHKAIVEGTLDRAFEQVALKFGITETTNE